MSGEVPSTDAGPEADTSHGFDPDTWVATRKSDDLYRDLQPVDTVTARAQMAPDPKGSEPEYGDEQIVFAANNYLGLAHDERVQAATAEAARKVGAGAGASRLVTGDTGVHRALERDLADAKRAERALVFSSGYATNVGAITALDPNVVFSDELNHASIIDGCRLSEAETVVYDHCDPEALAAAMALREREGGDNEQWLVLTDSVFSMGGDVAPIADICDVAERYGAWVMVDEAHATGLYESGGGIVQREGLEDRVHIQMGTLSKALGSQGGYVAGSEVLVEHLLNAARTFVFSTGLAPPAASAAREALRVAREDERQRERLWANVDRLRDGLGSMGYEVWGDTQILPVVVGDRADALALGERLREHDVIAPAIRPPTVLEGTSRIRIAPMATHTTEDVDACLAAFQTAGSALGLI
ncbi:8-amino-7-oxononanoate synthase [Halalkalicoccus paucihalophilus]|uniref:8-amino-7-oxononanoate synthase n=1 Tax=Halalkalicoccus paucihalophilus TaxID=1008153 RepID=A0A151A884_9EURY|nr:8-amino-7-oxononanoate synthase [Halalkalicoccus paucihalophilus]KYH23881.1 8-amino-7-oxononanoate synthase [Halalkalicoccus paucihalophilus]